MPNVNVSYTDKFALQTYVSDTKSHDSFIIKKNCHLKITCLLNPVSNIISSLHYLFLIKAMNINGLSTRRIIKVYIHHTKALYRCFIIITQFVIPKLL